VSIDLELFLERRPSKAEAEKLIGLADDDFLVQVSRTLRDHGHGHLITFSPKVFIPLTVLCRDVCHYCTFAKKPRELPQAYLSEEQVYNVAKSGKSLGCHEALFTLGDKPELRYRVAREELKQLGCSSTVKYLQKSAKLVFEQTGLLPHINAGILSRDEMAEMREVSASQGIMLESSSERLCQRGGPHFGSPDKHPAVRLANIKQAGELGVPFTTGILIGIGETREERVDALLQLRDLNDCYGHIQELIIQPFRAKKNTLMSGFPEPTKEDLIWTIAMARVLFGSSMNIQAPPNLSPGVEGELINAGINDWGGVSPVTLDHVNPEAPWPRIAELREVTETTGKTLIARLPVYPKYIEQSKRWLAASISTHIRRCTDSDGWPRTDDWISGEISDAPFTIANLKPDSNSSELHRVFDKVSGGKDLTESEICQLFRSRGNEFVSVCKFADELRTDVNGNTVTYVVNRNINYTNICTYRCGFCAFSKGSPKTSSRDHPYVISLEEIRRRSREAWLRGATEVCLQGGIHPSFTGETYLSICKAIKSEVPGMHIHAFSPLEVTQGAATLRISTLEFLSALKDAGLSTLPGTAAEILDDDVRKIICPDKIMTTEWLQTVEMAHSLGLPTTATIMFGHVDNASNWARHLIHIRNLQRKTGGFTEFVPLPFIHKEAPMYHHLGCRRGPTFRESILMHAVSRIVLYRYVHNIQTSWTKMGEAGAVECLKSGANDLGGTLMNESISRAAGNQNGQELSPERMDDLIKYAGRLPKQRTPTYGVPQASQSTNSYRAPPLENISYKKAGQTYSDLLHISKTPPTKPSSAIGAN